MKKSHGVLIALYLCGWQCAMSHYFPRPYEKVLAFPMPCERLIAYLRQQSQRRSRD